MPVIEWIGLVTGAIEFLALVGRNDAYKVAERHARSLGKPLVVVGGTKRRHPAGDLCIDLDPKSCEGAPRFMQADIRRIPLPDKYAGAVFASHILEHLPTVQDAQAAMRELARIADAVYVVSPSKLSVTAWLHPEHHLWVTEKDGYIRFHQRGGKYNASKRS